MRVGRSEWNRGGGGWVGIGGLGMEYGVRMFGNWSQRIGGVGGLIRFGTFSGNGLWGGNKGVQA